MSAIAAAFLIFTAIVGALSGFIVVRQPAANDFALPPLLWIFLAMAAFEIAVGYALGRPLGTLIAMPVRLAGAVIGVGLLLLIPYVAPKLI